MDCVKDVQRAQLRMLKDFIKICKEHNLRYYFIGGSLIGVYRHKGFIPWDDDIDLGMPRKDFERFCALRNQYPEGYSLTCHDTDPDWNFNLIQFVDNLSEIVIHMNEKPRRTSIWIDIFPIDGVPGGKIDKWWHLKKIMMYRYLIQLCHVRTQVRTNLEGRPWYEKFILNVAHVIPFDRFISSDRILKKMENALRSCDFDKMPNAGNLLGRCRERESVPQKWWGTPHMMPFEDTEVMCPEYSEDYLIHIYGNYMQLPPLEKRESHDVEIIKMR